MRSPITTVLALLIPSCVFLTALPAGATEARLLFAAYSSGGMGEVGPSLQAHGQISGRWLSVEALGGPSAKLESGSGWVVRGSADAWPSRVISVGAGYTYRNGGAWVKQPVWARVGIGSHRGLRLVLEAAPGSRNRERKAELQTRVDFRRASFEVRAFAMHHLQGTGYGVSIGIGAATPKAVQ